MRPADEEDTPELKYVPQSGVSVDSGARVVAVSDTTTAVYVPTPKPIVNIVDETGATIREHAAAQAGVAERDDVASRRPDHLVDRRQPNGVLRQRNFSTSTRSRRRAPTFRLDPRPMMAGRLLVPVTGGYDVFDPDSGKRRPPHPGADDRRARTAVVPAVAGSTVLEQRGDELVALG